MTILDQAQDTAGTEAHRLDQFCPPPAFVKQASREDRAAPPEGLPHLYADPRRQLYACHTPAAVWDSARFFADKQAHFKPAEQDFIRGRIRQTARFFGILPEIDAVFDKLATVNTVSEGELTDDDFALLWKTASGVERHYTLRNAAEVKVAADWLAEYRDEFTYPDRRQIARNILRKTAQFQVELGEHQDWLDRTAGFGLAPLSQVVDAWSKRANLTRKTKPKYAEWADKAAAALVSLSHVPDTAGRLALFDKHAAALDEFDRETHLIRLYQDGLARPEDDLFTVTVKSAAALAASHVPTATGRVYSLDDLAQVPLASYAEWLGDDIKAAIATGDVFLDRTKLAAILPTLLRPDAALLDRLLESRGISPVTTEKTAHRLDRAELEAWAAMAQPVS